MPSLGRRLFLGFIFLVIVVVGGGVGYWVIGGGPSEPTWRFGDCIYMTVITVTTVGYGEVLDNMATTPYARTFTTILLVFGTGVLVFFASTITAFIIEGDLRNVLFAQRLKKRMRRMKDHVIVCGAGTTGRNVIEELLKTGVPVVAIDTLEDELREIAEKYPKAEFSYIVGDCTDDDIMAQANPTASRGLVAALSSDKDNLYLVVSCRQTNPQARIVARAAELPHFEKLKRAGADAVVSPNHIGGMRLVSEMLRPAVVKFLDDMLRDRRTYRIEEIVLGERVEALGTTLRDAKIRERFGMTVLAMRPAGTQEWNYNPDPNEKLKFGMTLVVLGSAEQVAQMRKEIK